MNSRYDNTEYSHLLLNITGNHSQSFSRPRQLTDATPAMVIAQHAEKRKEKKKRKREIVNHLHHFTIGKKNIKN